MAIYIHDEAAHLRLRVTGELDDASARELGFCFATAFSVVGSRTVVMDLTNLSAAGEAGRQILEALHGKGVNFLAKSQFQVDLVREVTGARTLAGADANSSRGTWLKTLGLGVTQES